MTIQEILAEHGVSYREGGMHRHVTSRFIGVDCPWCGEGSGKYHLGISEQGTHATCWRCGPHRIGDVLTRLTGKPWLEVRTWLRSILRGVAAPPAAFEPRGRIIYPRGLTALTEPYRRYLRGREFDPDEIIRLWGVRATGPTGRLAWRLWTPITLNGEDVSWTTRSIGDHPLRYMTAGSDQEKIPAKRLLYGMDYVRHAVIVVEGPVDVWAVGPGAVAVMGLGITEEQKTLIGECPLRAICFDSEPAAQRRAEKFAESLQTSPGETVVVQLETGADAADADRSEIEELRRRFLK